MKTRTPSSKTSHTSIAIPWATIKQPAFILAALALVLSLFLAYRNHFNNPFHFDDDHTVVTNRWVRQLDSFPKFFQDARTTSSLPRNQAYRPGVTLLHAIDYSLSVDTSSAQARARLDSTHTPDQRQYVMDDLLKPKTFAFHVHIFIGFVLSGFLLFFLLYYMFQSANPTNTWNVWLALFGAGWFWLHTANAETINYVSARSDSASTFWILLTFVLYAYSPLVRRFHLYLITMTIGFFIKEPAIMFAPMLLFFVALFSKEEEGLRKSRTIVRLAIAFFVAGILFLYSRTQTPTTWSAGGTDPIHYLFTQAFVIVHYCFNFILPIKLSADTDWKPVTSLVDDRVLIGGLFIATLIFFIVRCWSRPQWRPVSFGLIWFFIALAPTSSIFPFAEVLNDHRTYFPYIGLIIAVTCTLGNILSRWSATNPLRWKLTAALASLFLVAHAYGAYKRSDAWSSGEKLWRDCIQKSPENGRAWMHYGMAMLEHAKTAQLANKTDSANYWYDSTEVCYVRANALMPYYSYLLINRGVMRQWQGRTQEAESFYREALQYDPDNPEPYIALANFLRVYGSREEALRLTRQGLALSPEHERLQKLEQQLMLGNPYNLKTYYQNIAAQQPSSDNYLNLSLAYYNTHDYENCIAAARQALTLDAKNASAWNNICTSLNQLGRYNEAIEAGNEALKLNPQYTQAKNNLLIAQQAKQVDDSLRATVSANATADQYLQLSLAYYNAGQYVRCIESAEQVLKLRANDAVALNNICSACNNLSWYDRAVAAGEKACALMPAFELAKNNLAVAKKGQAEVMAMKVLKE